MSEDSLESRVQSNPSSSHHADGHSDLENIVQEESRSFTLGDIVNYSLAGAFTAASYYVAGPAALFANALSLVGDRFKNWMNGKITCSRQVRDSSFLTSLLSPLGVYFFDWVNQAVDVSTVGGFFKRAFAQLLAFPGLVVPPALGLDYIVRHQKMEGAYEKGVKPYAWPFVRDNAAFFGVPNMLAAVYAPAWSHYYISGALGFLRKTTISQRHIQELDPYAKENAAYKKANSKYGSHTQGNQLAHGGPHG